MTDRPTAIIAANDMTAFAVISALAAQGLRVPADVSVIGFDGLTLGARFNPALTTICQPIADMGHIAIDLAEKKASGRIGQSRRPDPGAAGAGLHRRATGMTRPDGELPRIPGVRYADHVAFTVPDLDEAVRFFVQALGAQELYRSTRGPDAQFMPENFAVPRMRGSRWRCCACRPT